MVRLTRAVLLALCLWSLAAGPGVSGVAAAPLDSYAAARAQVLDLVNGERTSRGLPPLAVNDALTSAAQTYTNYMASANFLSHTAPDGTGGFERAQAAGYPIWGYLFEDLAGGQRSPERVVAAWMASPAHRVRILSAEATEAGVGFTFRGDTRHGYYWALEFGTGW